MRVLSVSVDPHTVSGTQPDGGWCGILDQTSGTVAYLTLQHSVNTPNQHSLWPSCLPGSESYLAGGLEGRIKLSSVGIELSILVLWVFEVTTNLTFAVSPSHAPKEAPYGHQSTHEQPSFKLMVGFEGAQTPAQAQWGLCMLAQLLSGLCSAVHLWVCVSVLPRASSWVDSNTERSWPNQRNETHKLVNHWNANPKPYRKILYLCGIVVSRKNRASRPR